MLRYRGAGVIQRCKRCVHAGENWLRVSVCKMVCGVCVCVCVGCVCVCVTTGRRKVPFHMSHNPRKAKVAGVPKAQEDKNTV